MRAADDGGVDAEPDAALLATAERLLRQSGGGGLRALVQLKGGRNNRVFRLDRGEGPPLALKSYFSDPDDPRDRLTAEWSFIGYAWRRGVRAIPEPLAIEKSANAALYSFVQGSKPAADGIGGDEIDAAADFVAAVNAPPRDPAALGPGSEACFSVAQHLATVERRVERLAALDAEAPRRAEAERFIRARLGPIWKGVRGAILATAAREGIDTDSILAEASCCLSPSDFGFHNALYRDGGGRRALTFLDFEYAGRDDPAKLVCDFFCQPETPAPLAYFERFLARLADGLALGLRDQARCRLLLEAYRVKWACIILNEFLPVGAARRAFADPDDRSVRCAAQLRKAEAMLTKIDFNERR
jgi:hypothetical protein